MKKKTMKFAALAGFLVILGGAYAGAVLINNHNASVKKEQEKADRDASTFYLSQMDQPTSVSYTNSYGSFSFSYDSETQNWSYDGDEHFPVAQSYLTTISGDMKSLKAVRKLETPDEKSVYGLDEPAYVISAEDSESGDKVTVNIGNINDYSGDYYAQTEGSDDIYTVSSSLVTAVNYRIEDLLQKESVPSIATSFINSLEFTAPDTEVSFVKETVYEPETEDASEAEASEASSESESESMTAVDTWTGMIDGVSSELTDTDYVNSCLSAAAGLAFTDCETYYADETGKESYGLGEKDNAAVLKICYTSGGEDKTFILRIGDLNEAGDSYYVSMNDSDAVNLVSASSIDELKSKLKSGMEENSEENSEEETTAEEA